MAAIVLLVALHFISLRYVRRRAMRFANYEAIERFTGEKILSKNYITLGLRVLTLLFLVLSISGMTIHYQGYSAQSDFVLAIDASSSMLADDFTPNRLEAAKSAASSFISSLPEDTRVGLISFAGISFVRQKVTADLSGASAAVAGLGAETVGGTALGDAIVSSSNLMTESSRSKTIILLTDGQSNVGVSVDEAVAYAKEAGVLIHTIGMGTEGGGTLRNTTFVSRLNSQVLMGIANQTGGSFYLARNETALEKAYGEIASSEQSVISFDASTTLLFLALVFFFIEWFLTNTKYRTLP